MKTDGLFQKLKKYFIEISQKSNKRTFFFIKHNIKINVRNYWILFGVPF